MMRSFSALVLATLLGLNGALVVKDSPCPFGYGTGCSDVGPISSATKSQVAGILEGILKNLNSHKALVQDKAQVSKGAGSSVAAKLEVSEPAAKVIQSLLSKARAEVRQAVGEALAVDSPAAACEYFGACSTSARPLDSGTKAEVAKILEGILGNLSKHRVR
mmetsp:Transcript_78992/g.201052  ORF Transcript_78992/g.201052 Transcript_78992/m.201052 type:complete len:162 (-) Transcript_78992:96-581(-)